LRRDPFAEASGDRSSPRAKDLAYGIYALDEWRKVVFKVGWHRGIYNEPDDQSGKSVLKKVAIRMRRSRWRSLLPVTLGLYLWSWTPVPAQAGSAGQVELRRVPDGGIQPQVAVDEHGTVHLVYFKGDPSNGDLFYATSNDGAAFSSPIRVNSVPGSAIAIGNIRGARIANGRHGNIYVIWNGSAKMGNPSEGRSPMLFSRLNEAHTSFEPERNLIHSAHGIDGGGGIAADQQGRVYVFWHAPVPGRRGEEFRRVWMTRSEDDGESFASERIAWEQPIGACGCCSLDSYADRAGRVYVLFRSAQSTIHRDMYLLESTDHGTTFSGSNISKWNAGYCVMSSEAFAGGRSGTYAAWESEKRVHFGLIDSKTATSTDSPVSSDAAVQKYPALAVSREGLILASWTEGMVWKRGGSVHWQLFDSQGQMVGQSGFANGVPMWSLVVAYARKDGTFVVLF